MLTVQFKWVTKDNSSIPIERLNGSPDNSFNTKDAAISWLEDAVVIWETQGYNDIFIIIETYTNG